jgi:ABC-2 type transport system permease protein
MSTTTQRTGAASVVTPAAAGGLRWFVSDSLVLTWRNLLATIRVPELLFFMMVQPIMFVLLFAYVFGGAIPIPGGGSYREYLMAGVFAQTVAFTTFPTAIGLAYDLQLGIVDRFRSLPMSRSAVLVGKTLGDSARMVVTIVVMTLCGLLIGWRIHNGVLNALAAFALLLFFGYSMTWIGALVGLKSPNPETAQTAGLFWLFPLTFMSNAFAPTAGMPTAVRVFAEWNPISAVVTACRELFGNPNPAALSDAWPAQHAIPLAIFWAVLIIAIFAPLSVRTYRKTASR